MTRSHDSCDPEGRRSFLKRLGAGAAAIGAAAGMLDCTEGVAAEKPPATPDGMVARRTLGKTGLSVSEIGFGGHSWSYAQVPEGDRLRTPTLPEAMRMISLGLDRGVNFFDSCTPREEHTVPGEVIKQLKKRDKIVVSARCCHKMKGIEADKEQVTRFVDQRLRQWQTDYFDILMLTNEVRDTPLSGYWDMSYCIEALEKVKQQGKVRFTGFGCHFPPEKYLDAFQKYGNFFDLCSVPYNIRHRAAEQILPAAKKIGLGTVTIKPFARGALLKDRDPGAAGLARDMIAFVLDNRQVDCCICGVHTEAHVRENLSASWTKLSPGGRERLKKLALQTACHEHGWLEQGWMV